jgi:membrane peptidoglycan carboxypeptidase
MMRKDVEPTFPLQTAERAYVPGHQIAGKTGTVNNNDSVTFVGSTPKYTGTVMVFRPLGTDSVGGFGGNKPATIWHDAMTPILTGQPVVPFPPADQRYVGQPAPPPPTSRNSGSGDSGRNRSKPSATPSPETPAAPATTEQPAPDPGSPAPPADQNPVVPPTTNGQPTG